MKKPPTIRCSLGIIYSFGGSLAGLEKRIVDEFGVRLSGHSNLSVEEVENDEHDTDGMHWELFGTRLKTEKEMAKEATQRAKEKARAEKDAAEMRARDLRELCRLTAKYGVPK